MEIVTKEQALKDIEHLVNITGSELGQDSIIRIARYIRQPEATPEGFCLDKGHRDHRARTGEDCTCPKYVRHPDCVAFEHRSGLPYENPWRERALLGLPAPNPKGGA